jgi:hypothetical protein
MGEIWHGASDDCASDSAAVRCGGLHVLVGTLTARVAAALVITRMRAAANGMATKAEANGIVDRHPHTGVPFDLHGARRIDRHAYERGQRKNKREPSDRCDWGDQNLW